MYKTKITIFLLLGLLSFCKPESIGLDSVKGTIPGIKFPTGKEWINVSSPLQLSDLKGKITILFFCTYSSLDCLSTMEELKHLQEKWNREIIVVGVHSPKYIGEEFITYFKHVANKYKITYPVISDGNYFLWKSYGVREWPTIVILNPDGDIVGKYSGKEIFNPMDILIQELIKRYDPEKKINTSPVPKIANTIQQIPETFLSYPSKILVNDEKLWVVDSGNHRILSFHLQTGELDKIIGSGKPGLVNGDFSQSRFQFPQGMFFHLENLYIADTGNHVIRKIDLRNSLTTTIAGTGLRSVGPIYSGNASTTAISYPMDILELNGKFYFTNAGTNQILRLDLQKGELGVFAGKSSKGLKDGSPEDSEFAQPIAIAGMQNHFFLADAENNSVRRLEVDYSGKVETLVGKGIFQDGDIDGLFTQAKLQFPLGIFYDSEIENVQQKPILSNLPTPATLCVKGVLLADSLNHKIKCLNLETKNISTVLGQGKNGYKNGKKQEVLFHLPSSITKYNQKLYISDTNNHTVRVYDIQTGETSNFQFTVNNNSQFTFQTNDFYSTETIELNPELFSTNSEKMILELEIPKGFTWTNKIPALLTLQATNPEILKIESQTDQMISDFTGKIELSVKLKVGESNLEWNILAFYIDEKKMSTPIAKRLKIKSKIKIRSEGKLNPKYKYLLSLKNLL